MFPSSDSLIFLVKGFLRGFTLPFVATVGKLNFNRTLSNDTQHNEEDFNLVTILRDFVGHYQGSHRRWCWRGGQKRHLAGQRRCMRGKGGLRVCKSSICTRPCRYVYGGWDSRRAHTSSHYNNRNHTRPQLYRSRELCLTRFDFYFPPNFNYFSPNLRKWPLSNQGEKQLHITLTWIF